MRISVPIQQVPRNSHITTSSSHTHTHTLGLCERQMIFGWWKIFAIFRSAISFDFTFGSDSFFFFGIAKRDFFLSCRRKKAAFLLNENLWLPLQNINNKFNLLPHPLAPSPHRNGRLQFFHYFFFSPVIAVWCVFLLAFF